MKALALMLLLGAGLNAAAQEDTLKHAAEDAASEVAQQVAGAVTGFTSFVSEHVEAARSHFMESGCSDHQASCEECTEHVAKKVAELAMAKMAAACKAGQGCPHACHQLDEEPKVMLGMMLVKLKPVELAEMYCAGKGVCTKRQLLGKEGFHATAMRLTLMADKEDVEEVLHKVEEMEGRVAPDAPHERMGGMPMIPRGDPECMHKVIERVMSRVVQPHCDAESGSLVAAACEFSQANPEVFRGMMLGKFEPWKFAAGYCAPHKGHRFDKPFMAALRWVKRSLGHYNHKHPDMKEFHECARKCEESGKGPECLDACPKPWAKLVEKCELFEKAKECHHGCQHDFACHFNCPKAMMPLTKMKVAKVVAHVTCHAMCSGDEACHKKCPQPWAHLDRKCAKVAEAHKCHHACGYDKECHHRCPHVWKWPKDHAEGKVDGQAPPIAI